MEVASAALEYYDLGWSIFPTNGKKPRIKWERLQKARATREEVEEWFQQWPNAGIAVALGPVSNLVRLDADSQEALGHLPCPLADEAAFVTPSGGFGWLFTYSPGLETALLWTGSEQHQELRLQSEGSYTVIPPTEGYHWLGDVTVGAAPQALRDLVLSKVAESALRSLEKELNRAPPPDKELVLTALAHLNPVRADIYDSWLHVGMALKAVGEDLLGAWDTWSQSSAKYSPGTCEQKWLTFSKDGGFTGKSIVFWAKQDGWAPPSFPLSDLGNSRRLSQRERGSMMYCHPWNKWLCWDGRRWHIDDKGAAMDASKRSADALLSEALESFTEAAKDAAETEKDGTIAKKVRAQRLYKHALDSQDLRHVEAALTLAQSDLPVLPSELDQRQELFNVRNGTVADVLQPHAKEDLLTQLCPHNYVEASCSRWESFLQEVFAGRANVVRWLHKFFGYCTTGSVEEQMFAVFHGEGSNGKSTMLAAVMHAMGSDYVGKAPRGLLSATINEQHPTSLASLYGKRLVVATETADSQRLDEALVKELTGGDAITCRRMREDFWTFTPTHKIVLATNYVPEVRGTDEGIWRRIRLVPFTVRFDGAAKDQKLLPTLLREAEGILRWMLEGRDLWKAEGLGDVPNEVAEATRSYRAEQDRLAVFMEEKLEKDDTAKLKKSRVMELYAQWCFANKEKALNGQSFGREIRARGVVADANYYHGYKEKA